MAQLPAAVRRDIHLDMTTISILRRLREEHAAPLGILLDDCVAECPCVVLVDLTRVDDLTTLAAAAIAKAAAATHPGAPSVHVMACGRSKSLNILATIPVHATNADAHLAARGHRERHPTTRFAFDRSVDAPATARRAVRIACAKWAIDHVAADAELIMSELVTNAIRHTNGAGDAAISLRTPFIHLAVTDQDPRPPRRSATALTDIQTSNGRGLGLVELLGSSWGHRVDHRGNAKVVWAAMLVADPRSVKQAGFTHTSTKSPPHPPP
jgi:anti-sigma regulatory factor (Ser/Thr protein kinase)